MHTTYLCGKPCLHQSAPVVPRPCLQVPEFIASHMRSDAIADKQLKEAESLTNIVTNGV